ncbi:HEAT repeat containing 3 [Thraustotheca clavata]|uniref:HEAT repeat containing 3 n=1 Tax=Thraustotheca clavata TaxID=74557 RepID=A0A1V9ZRD3_9STRA|nr:HEAT repeat containing 3 [Thraustotheca clavata]
MGKVKKRRNNGHKSVVPPTGGPTQAEIEAATMKDIREVPQFLSGLTSLQGSVREATCVALASYFGGDDQNSIDKAKLLQKMLNGGLLKKLLPCMVDELKLVRLHSLGALRNISVAGGLDVCEFMTSQDIITPCIKLIGEYATDDNLGATQSKDVHAFQILEQVFSLLTNLSESCSIALMQITHQRSLVLPALFKCLPIKAAPSMQLEAIKLMLVLSENNPEWNNTIHAEAAYQQSLLQLLQAQDNSLNLRLTTVGAVINLPQVLENAQSIAVLMPVLKAAIAYDAAAVVAQAQQASESIPVAAEAISNAEIITENENDINREQMEKANKAQHIIKSWKENVHVLTLGLELISNMVASGDDDEDEEEWGSDDEEGMEQAAQTLAQGQTFAANQSVPSQIFAAENILAHVYGMLQSLVVIPPQIHADIGNILHLNFANLFSVEDFAIIRERTCSCLANLLLAASRAELEATCNLTQVFQNLMTLYTNVQGVASDRDIASIIMAAVNAVITRSAENLPLECSNDLLGLIVNCAQNSNASVEARTGAIRVLGSLGQKPHSLGENKVLGTCMGQLLADTDLQVVCEVLNALFDIYSDETYDQVFFELNFLATLEHVGAGMKAKIKSEAKSLDRDLIAHSKETRLNLLRFIKYKKQHRR